MKVKLILKDGRENIFMIDMQALSLEIKQITPQKEEFYLYNNNTIHYCGNKKQLHNTIFLEITLNDIFEFNKKKIVDEEIYPDSHVWIMKSEDEKNWNENFKQTIFPK